MQSPVNLDFNIRYEEIIKLLRLNNDSNILEIGALPPACLIRYLVKDVSYLGINANYSNRKYKIKKMDFLLNNFKDNSFSHSVSTDTLEHVRKTNRQKFIDEMIRVTKKTIIIGVPNPEGREYEQALIRLLKSSKSGKYYVKFFIEHEKFGVPSKMDMRSYLNKYVYTAVENFNLRYWIGILLSDIFDFDIDLKKIPDINNKPAYRTFYVIRK